MNAQLTPAPAQGDLDAFWMPFTANRQFKANPRLLARAEGMYYWTADGREILDGVAGLWCVNAGHGRREMGLERRWSGLWLAHRRRDRRHAPGDYVFAGEPRRRGCSERPAAVARSLRGSFDHELDYTARV